MQSLRLPFVCVLVAYFTAIANAQDQSSLTSLAGEWTVVSHVAKTKERTQTLTTFFGPGDSFTFDENGWGKRGNDDIWWEYDKPARRFTIKQRRFGAPWSWISPVPSAKAVRRGEALILTYQHEFLGGDKYEGTFTLIPTSTFNAEEKDCTVQIEEKVIDRDFFTETYTTKRGVPKKIILKRDFTTSVNASTLIGAEAGGEAKLGGDLAGSVSAFVRGRIEVSIGTTIGSTETFQETYDLDGKEQIELKVRWVKRYRTGTVTLKNGSKRPFEVFIGYRTVPE